MTLPLLPLRESERRAYHRAARAFRGETPPPEPPLHPLVQVTIAFVLLAVSGYLGALIILLLTGGLTW